MLAEIDRYCAEWPRCDREPWLAVVQPRKRDLLRADLVVTWRTQTSKDYTVGYTHGLRWLAGKGHLKPKHPPARRWTPELLNAYVRDLDREDKATTSIHARVVALDRVLSHIAPELDRAFFARQLKRISRYSANDVKIRRLKESAALVECGLRLMAEAEAAGPTNRRAVTKYRAGFQIALLALRPLRLRNFAQLEFGPNKSLSLRGDAYWIRIPGSQTKVGKEIDVGFPEKLVPHFERYWSVWRPRLAPRGFAGGALWVSSTYDRPQGLNAIYKQIVKWTEVVFGESQSLNPHLFRDCLATSITIDDPSEWDLAHHLLGNTPTTVMAHYDHGGTRSAGKEVARLLGLQGE